MVMKRDMMGKNLRQSIRKSFGRYVAIALIIALGSGLFVGLRVTKSDMVATGQQFTDSQNMFDLRLITSYGWGREQLEEVSRLEGLEDVEGLFYADLIASIGTQEAAVYRFYTITETVDVPMLLEGRMPEKPGECLADGFHHGKSIIGTTVTVSDTNEESALDELNTTTFTVVGTVGTPLYMDSTRGSTSVGSGSISNYFLVPHGAFDVDYYTEIHATIPGSYSVYSKRYNDAMSNAADQLEPLLEPLAQERLLRVRENAEEAYRDGVQEYNDGVREYEDGKREAEEKLADGFRELLDAEEQLKRSEWLLKDGERQLEEGKEAIASGRQTIAQNRQALAQAKADAEQQMADAEALLAENRETITQQTAQVQDGLNQVAQKQSEVDAVLIPLRVLMGIQDAAVNSAQAALDRAIESGASQGTIAQLQAALYQAIAARDAVAPQYEQAQAGKDQLNQAQAELENALAQLQAGMKTVDDGYAELEEKREEAEAQFASAEAQLNGAQQKLYNSEALIPEKEQEIKDGWAKLEEGLAQYHEGVDAYREGKAEALQELADGEAKLRDARDKLETARETIDGMKKNDLIILDRNSNTGYASLDSNSDIVSGVSRVFPLFFILVAALVCITTMTRMVEEERTQIGTLKALGYSNGKIIWKYLQYAGSSALIGCILGIAVGSVALPLILWNAYNLIIFIPIPLCLQVDWLLSISVLVIYAGTMLLVTWYSCRRSLEEVPAELIRPKAPAAGKQMFFEKLSLWRKVSFLNKVTIRNIFRYHQRLAMMLVGIGGCTALLMTGFGIRDTIERIADTQFQEVALYDMQVTFQDPQTGEDQEAFRAKMAESGDSAMFFYQASVEVDADGKTSDAYLIASGEELTEFLNLRRKDEPVDFPAPGEVVVSTGIADTLGVRPGDTIVLRDPDMKLLELTVSAVFENYIYNYVITDIGTVAEQWGSVPEEQCAFVRLADGKDGYSASTKITKIDGVLNVSVNQELANMVAGMMRALDLVVAVVVFCAGLLATVVLYNLTNINVNERIREIATIKVLGFNGRETAMYIFKENLALTVMGTLLGLPMGKLLLDFVISQIKVSFVWFKPRLLPMSCVLSIVLTILAAVLVDVLFYYRLEKIDMAQALKSVE